jgi:hypothetical protein
MERQFVERFIDVHDPLIDEFGNRVLFVGGPIVRVMFASHFDTVHLVSARQKVRVNKKGEYIATSKHSNCLGADDTTGVYIMLELIEAGIPGVYVFHYGEEVGCIGAQGIASKDEFNILKDCDISIEFDRRGFHSIVTHQMGQRCASEEFATELGNQLGMKHCSDPSGIWTDNQEYVGHISEVCNLSVGYFSQHSPSESQCPEYVADLVSALIEVDYDALPVVRDPLAATHSSLSGGRGRRSSNYSGGQGSYEDLLEVITQFPDAAADAMWEYGFGVGDVQGFVSWMDSDTSQLMEGNYDNDELTDQEISQALADEISDGEWWESRYSG